MSLFEKPKQLIFLVLSSWLGFLPLASAEAASLSTVRASNNDNYAYYEMTYSGYTTTPTFRILLDTDMDPSTGYPYGMGADFMLQGSGVFKYSGSQGSWAWTKVADATFSTTSTVATWRVRLTDLAFPAKANVVGQTPSPLVASALVTQTLSPTQPIPTLSAPLPSNIVSGSTIMLNCGTTYYGSLNIEGLSNVTVDTNGTCGRAVITPAKPISGWTQYSGNPKIYVASVPQAIEQVFVDGQLIDVAHYPNSHKETGWLQTSPASKVSFAFSGLPSSDIVGAKLTYRGSNNAYSIGTRTVSGYDGRTISLQAPATDDLKCEEPEDIGRFYLEGKLWMLDAPNEWAWVNGKLYVWMPDGQAPGSRVMAAPAAAAVINARGSSSVIIRNIRVLGGNIGIDGGYSDKNFKSSTNLQILNTEVAYSNWAAIYAKNSDSLTVNNSDIRGALHTGIYSRTGSRYSKVQNSRFYNVNAVGMHKGSDGSIYINNDYRGNFYNNTVMNSGKTGISAGLSTETYVTGNRVLGACRNHGDCGGIYVFARGVGARNTVIETNTVSFVNGDPVRNPSNPERYAIYLDDQSNGIIVRNNSVTENATGMQLHLAYNNRVTGNTFSGNVLRHVLAVDSDGTVGSMHNNYIDANTFVGPTLGFWMLVGNPGAAVTFGTNTFQYYGSSPVMNPSWVTYH